MVSSPVIVKVPSCCCASAKSPLIAQKVLKETKRVEEASPLKNTFDTSCVSLAILFWKH